MSRIVICDSRDKLVTTLESILKHWGYRVLATNDPPRATEFLTEIVPDLVLIGSDLLLANPRLRQALTNGGEIAPATILIEHPAVEQPPLGDVDCLKVPFDIFELFAYVQKYLEKIPRRNLRLNISLPALISLPQTSDMLADVLSLSSHGLFVKTSLRAEPGQNFVVMLPLFGMKQEIEVPCRVIYTIQPSLENNYLQGFGVEFTSPTDEVLESLRQYLEKRLLEEIATHPTRISQVEADQMQTYTSPERLHLILKEIS